METALVELLTSDPVLDDLISDVTKKVKPNLMRQAFDVPYIIYSITEIEKTQHSGGVDALTKATVDISVFDSTYLGCKEIAEAVSGVLSETESVAVSDYWIHGCTIVDDGSDEVIVSDKGDEIHTKTLTFEVWYEVYSGS